MFKSVTILSKLSLSLASVSVSPLLFTLKWLSNRPRPSTPDLLTTDLFSSLPQAEGRSVMVTQKSQKKGQRHKNVNKRDRETSLYTDTFSPGL